ncbi:MAG: hypothetical protein EOP12_04225 [Pseudomonas sp.]|nr:MAG: hypothetical protein EOP12_04225 [Pseudomonas sp.]
MSTDIEKSFVATLTYNDGSTNKYGAANVVDFDFSYNATEAVSSSNLNDNLVAKNKDTAYLCANTNASSAAQLYFRWETVGSGGRYRIWVRSGPNTGKLLSMSNNGYLYANENSGRPHLFWLATQSAKDQPWKHVTGDSLSGGRLLIQQADSETNLKVHSKNFPDSSDKTMWWSYITAEVGSEERYISLNIKDTNVDYAPSDVWGKGKA